MQMIDALAAVVSGVQNRAEAAFDNPFRARHIARQQQDVTEQIPVLVGRHAQGSDVLLGDDENGHGRLGFDIAKRERAAGVSNDVRGNRACDNLAKEAVGIVHIGLPGEWARIGNPGINE